MKLYTERLNNKKVLKKKLERFSINTGGRIFEIIEEEKGVLKIMAIRNKKGNITLVVKPYVSNVVTVGMEDRE